MDSLQHLGLFLALLGGILLMRPSILQTRDSSSSSSSVTRLRGIMGATPGTCGTRPLPIPSFLGRMINKETRTSGQLPSLTHLTIEDACRGLQSGQFTSVALTKAYLARITEAAEFRAVLQVNPDALDVTRQLDEERIRSGARGYARSPPPAPNSLPRCRANRWWLGRSMGFHFWSRTTL